jgi:predicted phosphohydrolase
MNKITIQILSDIHLEFYKTYPKFKPLAKYLFLAGDIGTIESKYDDKLKNFLSYCSENWEKTYYVLGNHEFYQTNKIASKKKSFEDLVEEYTQICLEFPNVYLLNNSFEEVVPGLNVYGSTLWTGKYGCPYNLSDYLNDYNMIGIKSTNSTVLVNECYIDNLSKIQLDLLDSYLNSINITDTKTLIMTHFPPIRQGSSNPKYSSQPKYLANYFSWNNIPDKLNCSNVVGWISGHTHWSYDITRNNLRFISNQTGYKNEFCTGESGFESDKIFEIEY